MFFSFGFYCQNVSKGEKDDAVGTFSPTKWMKMSASIGTVHWNVIFAKNLKQKFACSSTFSVILLKLNM